MVCRRHTTHAQATFRNRGRFVCSAWSARRDASTALAQETSASSPGAATMSPARNTPSPRSTAGRSRQVHAGQVERPGAGVHHLTPAPCLAFAPVLDATGRAAAPGAGPAWSALSPGRIGICAWISSSPIRRDRAVGGGVAADPAGLVQIGDDRRDRRDGGAGPGRDTRCARSATAAARRPAARGPGRARWRRSRATRAECPDAVPVSTSTPSSRTRRSSGAISVLQPPTGVAHDRRRR